jgi:hypothetical protein
MSLPGASRLAPGRVLLAVLLSVFAAVWQGASPVRAAAAPSGLTYVSTSTWTADPEAGRVHVVLNLRATSHTVDSTGRRYYYPGLQITVPAVAQDFEASSGEDPLKISVKSRSPYGVVLYVAFSSRLHSGESCSIELRFDIVDSGGSTDRDLRIGRDLLSFPVSAFGTPDTPGSSVTVVFPEGFNVQEEYGGLTRSIDGLGGALFKSGTLADATELNAWFTAVKPVSVEDFKTRFATVGPLQVTLRYWPDDPGWADQVERVLKNGYPVLRDLIGTGDPIGTSVIVEEASTIGTGGFNGLYNEAGGRIRISYFADASIILHELSHMWFNSSLSSDRWINEGFASYYAEQTVLRLGLPDHAPVLTAPLIKAATPLNEWVVVGTPDTATEAYLYGASLEVARQIADTAGQEGLAQVWAEIRSGKAPYQPLFGPKEELHFGPTEWRSLLDGLEETTGASYSGIWRRWVVDASQSPELDRRDQARTVYATAIKSTGGWDFSPEIRRALDDWRFDDAMGLMSRAGAILWQRARIEAMAAADGLEPPSTLRELFEGAEVAAAAREANDELEVLSAIADAEWAKANSKGAARVVGLLGSDPDADLAAARTAFSEGNLDEALTLAQGADSAWTRASEAGQVRILGAVFGLAGLLLLLAVRIWTQGKARATEATGAEKVGADSVARRSGDA